MPTQSQEAAIRFGCFVGTLLAMAVWEFLAPRRPLTQSKPLRWVSNLGLALLNNLVWRLLMPAGAVGLAITVQARGWGLFNAFALPEWFEVAASVVLFDLAIYGQHWAFHRVPWLWRLHLVHHVDLDFDASTGIRFHTVEMLLSLVWKAVVIALLGAPALAVMIFEILLNATAIFNHSNARLPLWLDRALRLVLVTPDMHRVHHSIANHETNSNYGFCLPWWDFLFRTYDAQPDAGHDGMTIGRPEFRDAQVERFPFMLLLPFRRGLPPAPCRHRHDS
ncbi:MAG TPA: sterol desaturase family protein [Planctomycetaceae bacterium]|nr:sterol desaturase family protein [Planctomycetaceae bacterium]